MAKFKVGDRVRCKSAPYGEDLQVGDVYVVECDDDPASPLLTLKDLGCWYRTRFEPVEPYKLEKGATVCIGDGQDEWTVNDAHDGIHIDLQRGQAKAAVYSMDLRVVKPAPEKDYYVNAKGKPRDGDVYRAGANNTHPERTVLLLPGGKFISTLRACVLDRAEPVGERVLLVRNGKPWLE